MCFFCVTTCVQWKDESSNRQQTIGAADASARHQQDEHGVYNAPEVGLKFLKKENSVHSDIVVSQQRWCFLYHVLNLLKEICGLYNLM